MIRATCPTCRRKMEADKLADLPTFPFCTSRCRTIDQARWADSDYVVSRPLTSDDLTEDDTDGASPEDLSDDSSAERFHA